MFTVLNFVLGNPLNAKDLDLAPQLRMVLSKYCVACHGAQQAEAGINLSETRGQLNDLQQTEVLAKVYAAIKRGKMPPAYADPLPAAAKSQSLQLLLSEIGSRAELSPADHKLARRLTNFEYENTLRDLVGFDVNGIDDLPKDPVAPYQFNNTAEFMRMGPEQIDRYLEVARKTPSQP